MNTKLALSSFIAGVGIVMSISLAQAKSKESIIAPLADQALALDITRAGDALVSVGSRGHILVSNDDGDSWKQSSSPVNTALTGVYFADADTGWAVGHDAVVMATQDAGKTWKVQYSDPDRESPLLDIWFQKDGLTGYAVGAYGFVLATKDGGATWEEQFLGDPDEPDEFHLSQLNLGANNKLYMAAEAGAAYISSDLGSTWERTYPPYEGSFFGTVPLLNDNVLIFGLQGNVFRSSDAGESWKHIPLATSATLNSGAMLSDGTVVVTGNEGIYLISKDGGNSFKIKSLVDRKSIASIIATKDGGAVLVGEMGIRKLSKSFFK